METMIYKKALLYMLSGTGNTFRVCCWIKEMIENEGGSVELEMIDDANPRQQLREQEDRLIGLFFPAHGFMPPWSMIKFLFCFPRGQRTPAICVATRGCLYLGPLKIPGASGFATFLAALILFFKGYHVKGLFSLDMPANMLNLHSGLNAGNINRIIDKTKVRLKAVIERLQQEKHIYFTLNNLWEGAWTALLFWLVPVFPIMYLIFGRMFMAKMMFSNNKCVGCGLCAKSCGNQAIKMIKVGSRKYPFWTYHCENCMRCMAYCNKKAVEAGHSLGVALWYITSVPVVLWASLWLREKIPALPQIENYWLQQLMTVFYVIPALMIAYRLIWYLLRIKPVNTFFTYTTLTRFYRRYHEPETRLKHMTLLAKKNKTTRENQS
jgi:ferredoxin